MPDTEKQKNDGKGDWIGTLSRAAEIGDIDSLKYFHAQGKNMEISQWVGLRRAVKFGQENVVKWFLEELKADPSAMSEYSLKQASQNGFDSIVELLLPPTAEESRYILGTDMEWCLEQASEKGHEKIVNRLFHLVENPFRGMENPLARASRMGHIAVVKMLWQSVEGDPIKKMQRDIVSGHAFLMSLRHHQLNVAQFFIAKGVSDVSIMNYAKHDKNSVLNNLENAKALLEAENLKKKTFGHTSDVDTKSPPNKRQREGL